MGTNATDDIVAEAEEAFFFYQLLHQFASHFSDVLWPKKICIGRVYNEGNIKSVLIDGVLPNLRQSVHAYCGIHNLANDD